MQSEISWLPVVWSRVGIFCSTPDWPWRGVFFAYPGLFSRGPLARNATVGSYCVGVDPVPTLRQVGV